MRVTLFPLDSPRADADAAAGALRAEAAGTALRRAGAAGFRSGEGFPPTAILS